jgi:hypothetical protein
MKMAKRSFCGEFRKPGHAFKSKSFKGRHSGATSQDAVTVESNVDAGTGETNKEKANTGKSQTGGASPGGQVVAPPPPARPQTPPPATGGGGVDPEAYDPGANVDPTPDPGGGASPGGTPP